LFFKAHPLLESEWDTIEYPNCLEE